MVEELTISASGNSAFGNWVGLTYDASMYGGHSGWSGYSGWSGWPGLSGYSGQSGASGASGTSGASGRSGYSGWSGWSGLSGGSGWSGYPVFDFPRPSGTWEGGGTETTVYSTEVPQFVRILKAYPGADMSIFRMPTSWRSMWVTHTGVGTIKYYTDYEVFTRGYRSMLDRGFILVSGTSSICEYWNGQLMYCSAYSTTTSTGYSLMAAHLSPDWKARTLKWGKPYLGGSYFRRFVQAWGE